MSDHPALNALSICILVNFVYEFGICIVVMRISTFYTNAQLAEMCVATLFCATLAAFATEVLVGPLILPLDDDGVHDFVLLTPHAFSISIVLYMSSSYGILFGNAQMRQVDVLVSENAIIVAVMTCQLLIAAFGDELLSSLGSMLRTKLTCISIVSFCACQLVRFTRF
tara:strand:- start:431 stop:934 length:504 start_codon:yes stop_codon:yes gene_type:complete